MDIFDRVPSVFAILTPANDAARDAFSQVAQKKLDDEAWNPNAREHIQVDKEPVQVSTYANESESESGVAPSKILRPVLKGRFVFDLAKHPSQPVKGWLIGGGKFQKGDEKPDILLTERKAKNRVSAKHARLSHNFASGALIITTLDGNTIKINGCGVVDGQRVIHGRTTSLEFGNLTYTLEIRKYDTDNEYRNQIRTYKKDHAIPDDEYPLNLLATPGDSDVVTEKYILKNPIAEGSTCVVYAAYDRKNGNAVAVKKITRTAANAPVIAKDVSISKHIGEHPRICHLIDMIDPAAKDPNRGYKWIGLDEVFLVYMPLATWTLEHLILQRLVLDVRTCSEIFWQLLEGIEFLHSVNVMHRDIKPLNMAVISLSTDHPEARLIDFGIAQIGLQSDQYVVGTRPYVAPEIWAGAEGRIHVKYNEKVDIFAFGLSMYRFFCLQPCAWDRVDLDADGNVTDANLWIVRSRVMESNNPRKLMRWIATFINWNPQLRPSAKEVIEMREKVQSQKGTDEDAAHQDEMKNASGDVEASVEGMEISEVGRTSDKGKPAIEGPEK